MLFEAVIVSRWSVQCRDLGAHKSKIDSHLTSMMRPVIECILNHHVTRCFHHYLASCQQTPWCQQMFIGGVFERRSGLSRGLFECLEERSARLFRGLPHC